MIVAATSDTHGVEFDFPEADVFIHAGDMTAWGNWQETAALGHNLGKEPYKQVLLVPGNHDNVLEECPDVRMFPFEPHVRLLIDEAYEHDGVVFYGTPWTHTFPEVNPHCTAFMRPEQDLERYFKRIPGEVDVLITHGPPYGILDKGKGSKSLREAIEKRKIGYHLFGHIHESGGKYMPRFSQVGARHSYNIAAIKPWGSETRPTLTFNPK